MNPNEPNFDVIYLLKSSYQLSDLNKQTHINILKRHLVTTLLKKKKI